MALCVIRPELVQTPLYIKPCLRLILAPIYEESFSLSQSVILASQTNALRLEMMLHVNTKNLHSMTAR